MNATLAKSALPREQIIIMMSIILTELVLDSLQHLLPQETTRGLASDEEVPPKWPFYLQLLSSYVTVMETTQHSDRKGTRRIRILFRAPIITCNVLSNCVEGKTSLETGLISTHLQFRANIQLSSEKLGSRIIITHSGLH